MRQQTFAFLFLVLPLLARCQGAGSGEPVTTKSSAPFRSVEKERPLAVVMDERHVDPRTMRFHVDKSERRFDVIVGDSVLRTFRCVLGENPVGDKFHEGDRRTPEGTFTFRSKRVHDRWHKFIWVDHPNAESWRRYRARQAQGSIPPGKGIGGEIGIHGVPSGMDHWVDQGVDWTWGCLALRNADVDEIYPYIIPGHTEITIVP